MRRSPRWKWLLLCCVTLVAGCGPAREPYLNDPMLASKQPQLGRLDDAPPRQSSDEPKAPQLVPEALVDLARLDPKAALALRGEIEPVAPRSITHVTAKRP